MKQGGVGVGMIAIRDKKRERDESVQLETGGGQEEKARFGRGGDRMTTGMRTL